MIFPPLLSVRQQLRRLRLPLFAAIAISLCCCTQNTPHNGLFPFSTMEKPLSQRKAQKAVPNTELKKLSPVLSYTADQDFTSIKQQLQAGDVITFFMSHKEARQHLRKRNIQKIPYELFRYGHLAVLTHHSSDSELRLLQVAMKQQVNQDATLDYLQDKNWVVYRAPKGALDLARLESFSQQVSHNSTTYDMTATLGLKNGKLTPTSDSEIREKYTCTTLVVSALHYAGFQLHAPRRNGYFDVITPKQVVDSWGSLSTDNHKN